MNAPNYKRYLGLMLGLCIIGGGGLMFINWFVDPLQFYRKASYPPFLIKEKRFQVPGLAKNYPYDTIVAGTSVSENFEAKDVKENMGINALNISMQGASSREQRLALEVALRTGKVKNVIWDINYEYLRGDTNWVANYDGSFPFYFYDENQLNDINNYLLNVDTGKSSLKILMTKLGVRAYQSHTPDELYAWHRTRKSGLASIQKAWQRALRLREDVRKQSPEFSAANLNANFEQNVLKPIRQHPEVTFYLYLPPFSVGYYTNIMAASPEIFEHLLDNRRFVFEQTRGLKNVRLFDFQISPDIIGDAQNYYDLVHFNHDISNRILASMRDGTSLMTDDGNTRLRALVTGQPAASWVEKYTTAAAYHHE